MAMFMQQRVGNCCQHSNYEEFQRVPVVYSDVGILCVLVVVAGRRH